MAEKDKPKTDWRESRIKRIRVAVIAFLLKIVFRLLCLTIRFRHVHLDLHDPDKVIRTGVIIAVFHGEHFPSLYAFRNRGMAVIASQSADGELLARIMHAFGYTTVRGSSSRGGARALIDLTRTLKAGTTIAIAVDGPRGPRHEVKPGVMLMAKMTGSPVLPIAASTSSYWQFKSWDRFRVPRPFSKAIVTVGTPFYVPVDATDEQMQRLCEQFKSELQTLQDRCDAAIHDVDAAEALVQEQREIARRVDLGAIVANAERANKGRRTAEPSNTTTAAS